MVEEMISIKKIGKTDFYLIDQFLKNAGNSLSTFRYFKNRPINVIENHLITLVLIEDGQAVGYGHLDKDSNIIWLGIAVSDMSIGKGFGKMIMSFLVSKADAMDLSVINLAVDKNNYKAIRLYELFGFRYIRDISEHIQMMERKRNTERL